MVQWWFEENSHLFSLSVSAETGVEFKIQNNLLFRTIRMFRH